ASDACAASAVAAAHQMADLAFDFRAGSPVVGLPGGIGLAGAAGDQVCFVVADGDGAAGCGSGALGSQWAPGAGIAELSDPGVALAVEGADGRSGPSRAGHGPGIQVDIETVLGEMAFHP